MATHCYPIKALFTFNEEDWPLRGASCLSEPSPPNFGQALNPEVRAEHARLTLIYWENSLGGVWPDFDGGGSPKLLALRSGQFSSFNLITTSRHLTVKADDIH